MGHKYTSDVKQLNTGGIAKVFGKLERSRGIKVVSMGNTTKTAGDSFWTSLGSRFVRWMSKRTRNPPLLPQQTQQNPSVDLRAQPQPQLSHIQAGDILMICMQRGKRSKNIYQENLFDHNVDNDHALFVFLREMFKSHRGANSVISIVTHHKRTQTC